MNKIWTFIIMVSLIYAFFTNRTALVFQAIINVTKYALDNLLIISGMMIVYSGIFRVAIDAKLVAFLSKPFKSIILKLFKNEDEETIEYISANLIANMFSLGAASTPLAIKALEKMKCNKMLFILLNIASFTILPLSAMGMREAFNSNISATFFLIAISLFNTIFIIINYLVKK